MNKTQFYLTQCAEAASKSPMCFTLGAVMVKGGKVISSGYNHHRPHYDGAEVRTQGHRKPVSMHAEMHAIFNLTGMSPSFKKQNIEQKTTRQKGARVLSGGGFQGTMDAHCQHSPKCKSKRRSRTPQNTSRGSASVSGAECGGGGSTSRSSATETSCCYPRETGKGWDARRRDPRVNGADIYVARITKNGMGSASPCWRCLEWCRWAGIKRIFHWNGDKGKFDVVKVNSAQGDVMYETHADIRLFAGLGW